MNVNKKRKVPEGTNLNSHLDFTNNSETCQITLNVPIGIKAEIDNLCKKGQYDLDKLIKSQLIIMIERLKGDGRIE